MIQKTILERWKGDLDMPIKTVFSSFTALIIFFGVHPAQSDEVCRNTSQIHFAPVRTVEDVLIAQKIAALAIANDMTDFCKWNRMDRLAEGIGQASLQKYRDAKFLGDIGAAEKVLESRAREPNSPWVSSLAGTPYLKSLSPSSEFRKTSKSPRSSFDKQAAMDVINSADKAENFRQPDRSEIKIPNSEKDQREACQYLMVSDTGECLQATQDLLEFVALGLSPQPIIAVKSFSRILRDPQNKAGIFSAARKALNRIGSLSEPLPAHFFDDLVDGFKESGMTDSEARDRAWDIAYVYSVGGPNALSRSGNYAGKGEGISPSEAKNPNTNALGAQALIEAMVQLDNQPSRGRSVYSLPAAANFPCDSGKSYHFWMTAYLARYLRKKGYGEETSTKVAYSLAVAYQLKPIPLPGDDEKGSQRKPAETADFARFGTLENGLRIDLNLAAAGAVYGASDGKALKDLSQGFRQSIKAGGLSPNGTKSTKGIYEEWLVRLNPKAILDYYQYQR